MSARERARFAAWAQGGPRPSESELAACDALGFGALHALAEAEADGLGPAHVVHALCVQSIEAGASPRAAELEMGNTPLHWCCWHPAPGCALAALEAGASPSASNRAGEIPEDIAAKLLDAANAIPAARRAKLARVLELLRSHRERAGLAACCAAEAGPARARSI